MRAYISFFYLFDNDKGIIKILSGTEEDTMKKCSGRFRHLATSFAFFTNGMKGKSQLLSIEAFFMWTGMLMVLLQRFIQCDDDAICNCSDMRLC